MKNIILFLLVILFGNLFSQDTAKIRVIFNNELKLVDMYFNDRIFINTCNDINLNNVKIEYINYLNIINGNENFKHYKIIEVGVKTFNLIVQESKRQNILDSSVFKYFFVEYYGQYYKLLGFVSTDVNYLKIRLEKKQFRDLLTYLTSQLTRHKVLKKSEGIMLKQSLFKNTLYFKKAVHKPINIINWLYPERHYPTTIIDYDWIKPIRVN